MQRHRHREFIRFLTMVEAAVPAALREAIDRHIDEHNRDPRPFIWTADPDRFNEKVVRAHRGVVARSAGTGQGPEA
jgi:hypothetical protein